MCIVYDKLLKHRQSFRITLYNNSYKYNNMDIMASMMLTYYWLTDVNNLYCAPQVSEVQKYGESTDMFRPR